MTSPVIRIIASLTIAACSFIPAFAQEHASGHELQNHDSPAGRSTTAGRLTRLLYAPDPAYTDAARAGKIKGTVVIEGLLGTDGCLREIRLFDPWDTVWTKMQSPLFSDGSFAPLRRAACPPKRRFGSKSTSTQHGHLTMPISPKPLAARSSWSYASDHPHCF
jgi:hypothetical protein